MAFKSGFTNQYSTVRDVMAPGPLRRAAGFHYQEFTSLPEPVRLAPDFYHTGDQNRGSVWQEFLMPDTAETIESSDDPYWKFPAITRNLYGTGSLTYEATAVTDKLQRGILLNVLKRAALTGPDQDLPESVKVRHGLTSRGKRIHYYLNFSGMNWSIPYSYKPGADYSQTPHAGQARHSQSNHGIWLLSLKSRAEADGEGSSREIVPVGIRRKTPAQMPGNKFQIWDQSRCARHGEIARGLAHISLLSSGVVTHRSRKPNWPVSFTSRAASRKPVIAAR